MTTYECRHGRYNFSLDYVTAFLLIHNFAGAGTVIVFDEELLAVTKFPGNRPQLSTYIYNAYVIFVSVTITWPFASMPELSLWIFLGEFT